MLLGELVAIVNLIGLDSPCGVDEATLGCVWEGFPERIDLKGKVYADRGRHHLTIWGPRQTRKGEKETVAKFLVSLFSAS